MIWKKLLLTGGICSVLVGVLHIVIIFWGAPAYRYFGAGEEMAVMANNGSLVPALVTLIIAIVFIIWGVYAFSGAGLVRRYPMLRMGLFTIGSIYTLRGLLTVYQIYEMTALNKTIVIHAFVFSLVSLFIGILYLLGVLKGWRILKTGRTLPQ